MIRLLAAICTVATLATLALQLHLGDPGRADWWPGALAFMAWAAGAHAAPWPLARLFPDPAAVRLLTLVALGSSIGAGIAYHRAFFVSGSSTAALALLFVPLVQWLALAATGLLLLGWRIAARCRHG